MDEHTEPIFVISEQENVRLDAFLPSVTSLSRSRAVQLISSGLVTVNGRTVNKKHLLAQGDRVEIILPPDDEIDAVPENIPLDVVFEDEHIIVINKPQNMVVHPAPGNPSGTLVNALLYHCKDSLSGINGKLRPGIVHRIDKDTSGLIVAAKNDASHNALAEMFRTHNFTRKYQAILYGAPKEDRGIVHLAIGRSKKDRKKMAFYPPGAPNTKDAITGFEVLERFPSYSHVELTLETGRTHQIRVHMLSLGCPVLGDPLYAPGRKSFGLVGQCLHAKTLHFTHPITKRELHFDQALPPYFEETLDQIRRTL